MIKSAIPLTLLALLLASPLNAQDNPISFEDVTQSQGLTPLLAGWSFGHCGAWGDWNGDGRPDLYLGAFADRKMWALEAAPVPNPLFLNMPNGFALAPDQAVRMDGQRARTTYALAVDLDNDGDQDLLVFTHAGRADQRQSALFENDGHGRFTERTAESVGWPHVLATRNVAPIDLDGDGLLDLIMVDADYLRHRKGTCRVYALRQDKPWHFQDVTASLNLPLENAAGNGLGVGDVNNDGQLDFFIADSNRLFVSTADRTYREADSTPFVGAHYDKKEGMTCGAALGDLNGDGELDLVTTVHGQPGQVEVYLQRTPGCDGLPCYERITKDLGLETPLPTKGLTGLAIKGAYVAIQDFDNDGRNDVLLAMICRDERGRQQPVVLRNLGNDEQGRPKLSPLPMDRLVWYSAQAPVADFDGDGRLDVFFPSWFAEAPSTLLRNTTGSGNHWLTVKVESRAPGLNRQGLGATVRLFEPGTQKLLGRRDIAQGNGYSAGELPQAHFGLGGHATCDVQVQWQGRKQVLSNVATDHAMTVVFEQ